jgi:hypothetical protein
MKMWKSGIQTVSLIDAVKQYSTGSLVLAKAEVERFLAGEVVILKFNSELEKARFRKEAEKLGVIFKE